MEIKKLDNVDLEKNDIKDEEADKDEKKNDINSTLKSLAKPLKQVCGGALKTGLEMQT
jgi:hypothetical protein